MLSICPVANIVLTIVLTLVTVWDTMGYVLREVYRISRWRLVLNLLRFSELYS